MSKKVDDKKNVKEVESKSAELSPKKAPVKSIKDMFKKSTPSAPVTINLDEKSAEEKSSSASIKKTVEKAAEDKKKKQAEDKKKAAEEEKKKADEKAKAAEEEKKRAAEEKKKAADEKKRLAEEKKKQAEDKKKQLAEEKKQAEEKEIEKKKAAEEEKRLAEEKKHKAEEEKKRKQAEEAEKKRAVAEETAAKTARKTDTKKHSKELSSDENTKQTEGPSSTDATKKPKFSLSATNRSASSKKISLSTATKSVASGNKSDDGPAHEEDLEQPKETSSQRKRVITDEDEREDKMDLDSNDVAEARADMPLQSTPTKQGIKRKRSGSLANSVDEGDDKVQNRQGEFNNTNATSSALMATPQGRNVKRFKKVTFRLLYLKTIIRYCIHCTNLEQSVSPTEKSPRPKIISTEVHDLSKDKKEHEIWFKTSEKEYTEVRAFTKIN